jgi:molecular chaperone DnaK
VLRIINEPTAASLAYGLDKKKDEKIAVYDLGGGTFDVSMLEIGDGVFEVKATNGDTHLGGDDWDDASSTGSSTSSRRTNGIDLRKDPMALQRLKEEAEKAKIALSSSTSSTTSTCRSSRPTPRARSTSTCLTRAKMEQMVRRLFERCGPAGSRELPQGRRAQADKIDELVLVGGMTRMPKVVEMAKTLGGKEPHQGVNPDEVVAIGAAIQGGVLKGEVKDVLLLDVTPLTLGIETRRRLHAADRAQHHHPHQEDEIFSTYSDNQPGSRSTCCRASARWPATTRPRHVQARRHPARAARHAADRGHLRHRRQRHPARQRQGSRHRQGAEDHHHRPRPASPRKRSRR